MPRLADPPQAIVKAVGEAARRDSDAATWVGDLDKFYCKQDASLGLKVECPK